MPTGLHSWTHYRFGPDPLYIEGLAFLPLTARPSDPPAMTVTVEQAFYRYDGTDKVWEEAASTDLTSFVPTSPVPDGVTQHFVIICLDRTDSTLVVVDGTSTSGASSAVPFTVSDVSAISIDATYYPIAAIRFYFGQTTIQANDIFMDRRLWGSDRFYENIIMTDGEGAIMVDGEGDVMVQS